MNKKIILIFICLFIMPAVLGESWYKINVYKNDLRAYIDVDSINEKAKNIVEYTIKYEDLTKKTNKILYAESDCEKNLSAIKVSQKNNAEFKTFAKDSAISYLHTYACNSGYKKINDEYNKTLNWGPYMRDMEQNIKRNWNPPKSSTTKRVVVNYTIGKDGTLLNKRIVQSSGNPMADRAAMEAIDNTAPFSPLPYEYKGQSIPVEFTFDYNVLDSTKR